MSSPDRSGELSPDKADRKLLALWAADCAEHVLVYFERCHPRDRRPRDAVQAGRAWARGEISVTDARRAALAAHAAARKATHPAARAAARAAGHAAATAHAGGHATHAATYAVRAAAAAIGSMAAAGVERDWQHGQLPQPLRPTDQAPDGEVDPDRCQEPRQEADHQSRREADPERRQAVGS